MQKIETHIRRIDDRCLSGKKENCYNVILFKTPLPPRLDYDRAKKCVIVYHVTICREIYPIRAYFSALCCNIARYYERVKEFFCVLMLGEGDL